MYTKNGICQRLLLRSLGQTASTGGHLPRFGYDGLFKRTPAPPPFWSMNSTPAASKARRIAKSLAAVMDVAPSARADSSLKGNPISPHWKGWCDGRRLHTTDGCGAGEDRAWTT